MQDRPEIALTPRPGPLPPFARIDDFLEPTDHDALLEWVLANPDQFAPATVTKGQLESENKVDLSKRICATSRDLGPLGPVLRERFMAAAPDLMAQAGIRFSADWLELELAAHGDGAFFTPHTDLSVGASRRPLSDAPGHDRRLSAVYYFHARPKGFSGGDLILYRFGAAPKGAGQEPANQIVIEPNDNRLVAFPSWVQHEVIRVSCPSDRFEDRRFAVNCWYCEKN